MKLRGKAAKKQLAAKKKAPVRAAARTIGRAAVKKVAKKAKKAAKKKAAKPVLRSRRANGGSNPREETKEARMRVLEEAHKQGVITNERAREVGGWVQAWYHLNAMKHAGLLRRDGFNVWRPR